MPDEPPITQQAQGSYIAQATHGGTATVQVVLPPASVQEQNRVRFLKRLHYRYSEEWEQSLEGAGLLTLGLVSKPDAVLHHTGLLFLSPQQPERLLPPGTSIAQVYEQAGQELLILGEPGAGKSTLLLDLARRLVECAEQDAAQPLPVIIPLSTWAVKQQPLTDWLSEQLTQLYDVPRRLSHSWVQTDQLLLLLDGFDEVPQKARVACIKAIAAYRKEHLVSIVVCSRRTEFEEIPRQQRLVMQSALVVQPLTQEQVEAYLLQGGEAFSALRTVLHINPVLQELVTTPLMLHILTLTYTGSKARDLPQGGSPEEQQRRIFASYIERMIERRRNRISFPLQRIIPWLIWLAKEMQQYNQTLFSLEQMQPDWLEDRRWDQAYERLAVRLPAILMGVLVGLIVYTWVYGLDMVEISLFGLLGGFFWELFSESKTAALSTEGKMGSGRSRWYGLMSGGPLRNGVLIGLSWGLGKGWSHWLQNGPSEGLFAGLVYGVGFGLSSLLTSAVFKGGTIIRPRTETMLRSKSSGWSFLLRGRYLSGMLIGVTYWLFLGLSHGLALGLLRGRLGIEELVYGLGYMLRYGLPVGLTSLLCVILVGRDRTIQPAEILVWSWSSLWRSLTQARHLRNGLLVGGLTGLTFGLSWGLELGLSSGRDVALSWGLRVGLSMGPVFGLSIGLTYWLLLGLFQGVSSQTLEKQYRLMPNQGIRRSARNGLLMGLLSGSVSGVISSLAALLNNMLLHRLGILSGPSLGLSDGLSHALSNGLASGLLAGLLLGGLACLRHYVLRFLLWRSGAMPWHYVRFLDEAAGCILLRRVGGGYSFMHRLILDYFASLDTPLTKPEPP